VVAQGSRWRNPIAFEEAPNYVYISFIGFFGAHEFVLDGFPITGA
jgi:hypothetical protein